MDHNYAQEQIAAKNPGYKKKAATDHKIAELVKNDYHLRLMTYQQRFGNEIVKNSLKPEDREKADYGIKMFSGKNISRRKRSGTGQRQKAGSS